MQFASQRLLLKFIYARDIPGRKKYDSNYESPKTKGTLKLSGTPAGLKLVVSDDYIAEWCARLLILSSRLYRACSK